MYSCLKKQLFEINEYKIVPIRLEDRYDIMKWRNEQIYHLRQNRLLNEDDQDHYFENVIKPLFHEDKPSQILYSYLYKEKCIGYGGLVHINWVDRNAELSFIIDTSLEKNEFDIHYTNYLQLIEEVAFIEIGLHKIFTFAFDVRPRLYEIFEKNGFDFEARLKDHVFFNNNYIDVVIHKKINFHK
jgi:RimJ/RimL family protein N-acetyltransferase